MLVFGDVYIHTLHYITLHYITLHYITWHDITLHYITLYTLHCITLHYITLHCITLHYIHTCIHMYIHNLYYLYSDVPFPRLKKSNSEEPDVGRVFCIDRPWILIIIMAGRIWLASQAIPKQRLRPSSTLGKMIQYRPLTAKIISQGGS